MRAAVWVRVATVAVAGLVLAGVGVGPRVSAHLTGEEYRFRVEVADPGSPSTGGYVELYFTDLRLPKGFTEEGEQDFGAVYVPLVRDGDVWRGGPRTDERPDHMPYLTCAADDWQVRCGIEKWYAGQDDAQRLGEQVRDGGGVATVKVDDRGNAVIVGLETG